MTASRPLVVLLLAAFLTPAAAAPPTLTVASKPFKLDPIEKQTFFGVGIAYIAEDFYFAEETTIGRRKHKAGSPVEVISAEFKTPGGKYVLYLFDTSKDGKFTPYKLRSGYHDPRFGHEGDGMVLAYPDLENLFVVPFRDTIVLDGRSCKVRVDGKKVVLTEERLLYNKEREGKGGVKREVLAEVSPEVLKGVERINLLRARAGLHNLAVDLDAMKGTQGHADELIKRDWDGCSDARFDYGSKCLVGAGGETPEGRVEEISKTTYESKDLYSMARLNVGFGWGFAESLGGVGVIELTGNLGPDYRVRSSNYEWKRPFAVIEGDGEMSYVTVVPPHGSESNPTSHVREARLGPISEHCGEEFGPPIYVCPGNPVLRRSRLVSAVLEHAKPGDQGGERDGIGAFEAEARVEIAHALSRHNPIDGSNETNWDVDNILARSHLAPDLLYRVTFTYDTGRAAPGSSQLEGETEKIVVQWVFRTRK